MNVQKERIKDAPTKVIDDVGQEYDPTEVEKEMVDKFILKLIVLLINLKKCLNMF